MSKENKEVRIVENKDVFVVVNPKGGVGKSAISKFFLPAILLEKEPEKKVNIYEIDNNNAATSNLFQKSEKINYKKFKIKNQNEAIFDLELTSSIGEYSIVDCGGGDDVSAVLSGLAEIGLTDVNYIIPTNDDDEQFENVVDCIEKILAINPNANIRLVFNRVWEDSKLEEQFIAFFGDKEFNIPNSLVKIEKFITCKSIVPQTKLLFLLKNQYRMSLADYYFESKNIVDNEAILKSSWIEEVKKSGDKATYYKNMENLLAAKKTVEFVETLSNKYFKL